jgi:hypothetical protein
MQEASEHDVGTMSILVRAGSDMGIQIFAANSAGAEKLS